MDVRIQGDSMWPTFSDGEVLLFTAVGGHLVSEGDVVLVNHPFKPEVLMVKRVLRIEADGRFFLVGDNPDPLASEDSHNFGSVSLKAIRGKLNEG